MGEYTLNKRTMRIDTEKELQHIAENIDIIYAYLDLFIDSMSEEEIAAWNEILEKIDPEYKINQNE